MTKLFATLLFFLFSLTINGQTNSLLIPKELPTNSLGELLYVHINSATLLCGETLLYKIYCLQPTLKSSEISKVVYVQLLNRDKAVTLEQKLFLKDGIASGDLFIPTSVKTGHYSLLVYTKWMFNNTDPNYFTTTLSIINPFQSETEAETRITTTRNSEEAEFSISPMVESTTTHEKKGVFSLKMNQSKFSNRDLVTLLIKSISKTTQKGNYSISVRKKDSLIVQKTITSVSFSKNYTSETIKPSDKHIPYFLPELRGEQISGKIMVTKENVSVKNIPVGLSIPGENFEFKIVKTNSDGKFLFHLDKEYIISNLVAQVLTQNREDYIITIDDPQTLDLKIIKNLPPLQLNPIQENEIIKRSIANQIQNAYHYKKRDSIIQTKDHKLFYGNLAKDYILDDYTRFPTLKEVITEIVKEMYFTKEGHNYSIGLKDYKTDRKLTEPALVLVDGLLIQDVNELFDWNMNNVSKFSIIPGGYYYGGNLFNGVVSIITKRYDFESKSKGTFITKTSVQIPVQKKIFFQENYADFSNNNRIPDYRYQLAWIPEINLEEVENSISFYTSDINGTFEIIIEGFSEEGIPVSIKEYFEVK